MSHLIFEEKVPREGIFAGQNLVNPPILLHCKLLLTTKRKGSFSLVTDESTQKHTCLKRRRSLFALFQEVYDGLITLNDSAR